MLFKIDRKKTVFKKITFELYESIKKQIKTCPDGQVLKLWLCSVCSSRAELLEIGREIDSLKDKLCIKLHD